MIPPRVLETLGANREITTHSEKILDAVSDLRWHQALRKRTQEARLASVIWTATTLADRAGLPRCGDLATRVVRADAGDDERWRLFRPLRAAVEMMDELGGAPNRMPPGMIIMRLIRDSALQIEDYLPFRRAADLLAASGSGLVRTALAMAMCISGLDHIPPLKRPRATALMLAVGKVCAVRSGLEPTGVAVVDDPQASHLARRALAGSHTATIEWCSAVGTMLHTGVLAAEQVCSQVVAGRR
ncbi:MAG: hypothetical protein Q4Q03_06420 [Bowdeniella nasicola]|nr:hypothetical protein [Bowdeniella nasicola]